MKKYNLITLFALPLAIMALNSCGETKVPGNGGGTTQHPNNPVATIKVTHDDSVLSYKCSLNTKTELHSDDEGYFIFTLKENYLIDSVRNSDITNCVRDKDNMFKYHFSLFTGENEFVVKTYKFENIWNDNGTLDGPNNHLDYNGQITDEVDDKPTIGGHTIPPVKIPEYKNGKDIYFIDSSWWNDNMASTSIITYDAKKNIINTQNTQLGDVMKHIKWNETSKENIYKWAIDMDKTKYVQFVRTSNEGGNDYWGAKTDILPVQNPYKDTFKIEATPAWEDKGNMTKGTWMNFTDYKPVEPPKPDVQEGVYYLGLPKWYKNDNAKIVVEGYKGETKVNADIKEIGSNEENYIFEITTKDLTAVQVFRNSPDGTTWNHSDKIVFADYKDCNIFYLDKNGGTAFFPATIE